jgi:PTH2 family peptidyl-tRNA hydrolase
MRTEFAPVYSAESTVEMQCRVEMLLELEGLLEPVRQATGNPDFGRNHLLLAKMERIEGVPAELSDRVVQAARHLRNFDVRTNADVQWELHERKRTMAAFTSDYRPLVMYAIYRDDLQMRPEKLAPICGHAYVESYKVAAGQRPAVTSQYEGTGHGTKLCMYAKNIGQLMRGYRDIQDLGLPHKLIIDRGDVLPPNFDGNPLVAALGIGPVYKDEVERITKRYSMRKHR